jgi:hypothetical protein
MCQAWKQANIVSKNMFNPFEYFGTVKVEFLDLEEAKPWLDEIFMKTQRQRKRKRL